VSQLRRQATVQPTEFPLHIKAHASSACVESKHMDDRPATSSRTQNRLQAEIDN